MEFLSRKEYKEAIDFFDKYISSKDIETAKLAKQLKDYFIKNFQIGEK